MLPLASRRLTGAGLCFYTPGRRLNRLAVGAARLLAALGAQRLLGRRLVLLARAPGDAPSGTCLLERLGALLGRPVTDVAVHTGHRKHALLLLDGAGHAVAVAKVGDGADADRAIAAESATLRRLARGAPVSGYLPALLAEGRWAGHAVQVQAYVPASRLTYATRLTRAHLDFLAALAHTERREAGLHEWGRREEVARRMRALARAGAPEAAALQSALASSLSELRSARVPFHRVHGDFAPWNVRMLGRSIKVVDWEESEAHGLPFYDLVHFAVRVRRLLKRRPTRAEELLAAPISVLGIQAEVRALWAILARGRSQSLPEGKTEALIRLCVVLEHLKGV